MIRSSEYDSTPNTSISVLHFENEALEKTFLSEVASSYEELRQLLPHLPEQMNITFGANYEYGATGVTGSAITANEMLIGIDQNAKNREVQHARIRPLVFHEGYHIAQGFHNQAPVSALEAAIYEGCATLFEVQYAQVERQRWSNYEQEKPATLERWLNEIKTITAEQYFESSGETWQKWAFYDPETDESWRIYKVGTWLVEGILKNSDLSLLEMGRMRAEEIIRHLAANEESVDK